MANSVPRIVYHTVKRFLNLLGVVVIVAGSVVGLIFLSQTVGPWLVFPLAVILYGIFMSYQMAKHDVEREKIEQERVERALKKDWK